MIIEPTGLGDGFLAGIDTKANAERIIACVNALAGIEKPETLIGLVKEFFTLYESNGTAQNQRLFARIRELLGASNA